jgi:hypothetical protein
MVKVKIDNEKGLVQSTGTGAVQILPGITGNSSGGTVTHVGYIPDNQSYDIAAGTGGALSLTSYINTIASDGTDDNFTLADGLAKGQLMKVIFVTDGTGDAILTIASAISSSLDIITFSNVGDTAELMWNGTAWRILGLFNTANGGDASPVVA